MIFGDPSIRAALGGSLAWEEMRGDYEAARKLAQGRLARANTVEERTSALLEWALVSMLSGRPRAAAEDLAGLLDSADPARRMCARVLQRFADQLAFHHGPAGDSPIEEEAMALWDRGGPAYQDVGGAPLALVGESAARELAFLALAGGLGSGRAAASAVGLGGIPGADAGYELGLRSLDEVAPLAGRGTGPCGIAWIELVRADLRRRAGDHETAWELLHAARRASEQAGDVEGTALCAMTEGDWRAVARESPVTLGLSPEPSGQADDSIDPRVEALERAAHPTESDAAMARISYAEAAQGFERAGCPRGLAAVELRLAGLAAFRGETAEARRRADSAESRFLAAGDAFGRWTARIHGVLADVDAGTPVDRARVVEIGEWGRGEGSLGFAIGLGRLLARAGRRRLIRDARFDEALACFRLAEQLFHSAGTTVPETQALVDQAGVHKAIGDRDAENGALHVALDRFESLQDWALRRAVAGRRVDIAGQLHQLHNTAMNPDGMLKAGERVTAAARELGMDGLPRLFLAKAITATNAVVVPLYRAIETEEDPASTVRQRAVAWEAARSAAAESGGLQRDFHIALVHAARHEDAAAAAAAERYFAGNGFLASVEGLVLAVPHQERAARVFQARQALALFLRVRAAALARVAVDALAAIDGPDWWRGEDAWLARGDEAEVHLLEGDFARALELFSEAMALFESTGAGLRDDRARTAFADSRAAQRIFVYAAAAALASASSSTAPEALQSRTAALEALERGRARALLDLVVDTRAGGQGEDSALGEWRAAGARRALRRNLIALETERGGGSTEMLAEQRRQLAADEAELARIEADLARAAPDGHRLFNPRASVTPVPEILEALPAGAVLLEIAFAGDTLISLAVTRDGVIGHHVADVLVHRLRRLARAFSIACSYPGAALTSGDELAELLILPFASAIRGADQLIIVSSGALHAVPFHALPFDGAPLIARLPVSYAPSASLVPLLRGAALAGANVLAVGNPDDMRAPSALLPTASTTSLAPLPGAEAEAIEIGALMRDSTVLTGASATRDAVAGAVRDHRILHFATHGLLSRESPWSSSIALAKGGQLMLADLMGMRLAADLVVLSACDTGGGEITHGNEVLGLARGILAAGARATIVSLWPVFDAATSALMVELYRGLHGGLSPAAALRAAQLNVQTLEPTDSERRRNLYVQGEPEPPRGYRHPAYWAPFVLMGA